MQNIEIQVRDVNGNGLASFEIPRTEHKRLIDDASRFRIEREDLIILTVELEDVQLPRVLVLAREAGAVSYAEIVRELAPRLPDVEFTDDQEHHVVAVVGTIQAIVEAGDLAGFDAVYAIGSISGDFMAATSFLRRCITAQVQAAFDWPGEASQLAGFITDRIREDQIQVVP